MSVDTGPAPEAGQRAADADWEDALAAQEDALAAWELQCDEDADVATRRVSRQELLAEPLDAEGLQALDDLEWVLAVLAGLGRRGTWVRIDLDEYLGVPVKLQAMTR